jgi:hypothetical protein
MAGIEKGTDVLQEWFYLDPSKNEEGGFLLSVVFVNRR